MKGFNNAQTFAWICDNLPFATAKRKKKTWGAQLPQEIIWVRQILYSEDILLEESHQVLGDF